MTPRVRKNLVRLVATMSVVSLVGIPLIRAYATYRFAEDLASRMKGFQAVWKGIAVWDECRGAMPTSTYHDPSGRPCYSWRLAVLTYIVSFDYEADVPWNAKGN